MLTAQLIGAIDHCERRSPGFYRQRICETWLRREDLDPAWFMRTLGGGDILVIQLRGTLLALLDQERKAEKRESAQERRRSAAS